MRLGTLLHLHSLILFNEWATSYYTGWTKMPSIFFSALNTCAPDLFFFFFFWKCPPKDATSTHYSNAFFFLSILWMLTTEVKSSLTFLLFPSSLSVFSWKYGLFFFLPWIQTCCWSRSSFPVWSWAPADIVDLNSEWEWAEFHGWLVKVGNSRGKGAVTSPGWESYRLMWLEIIKQKKTL